MATVEKLEGNQAKLTIEVSKEEFGAALQQSYVKNVKRFQVPGFRKGKAPRKVIESMYGEGAFYEDAFDAVYGPAYTAAIQESELLPVSQPELDIVTISAEEGVVFTATVYLKPEVTLGEYKGIEVVKQEYTVGDEDIETVLQQEREKAARYLDVDRPAENGDNVILDYSGSVDGVKFEGGTAEDQSLLLGSGTFIPGFEDQLIGMKTGDEGSINVTFPEDYHAEELKGKAAVFEVKIKNVQKRELPELDDEFAKDISEFDTLEELRADKRREMQQYADNQSRAYMQDMAVRAAAANATMDIPDCMVETRLDGLMQDFAYQMSMSGLSFDDYLKYTGTDMNAMREEYREEALSRVRTDLTLEAIAKVENFEASEEDVDKELELFAKGANQTAEEMRKTLAEEDMVFFKDRIVAQKAADFILDNAVLVDAPPAEEPEVEAPKKVSMPAGKKEETEEEAE